MLTRGGILVVLTLTGCGLLDSEPRLRVEFDSLALAVPPDTLQLQDDTDWYEYPPIISVSGSDGRVIVRGDYTLSCANSVLTGVARFAGDRLEVLVGHETPGPNCLASTPKVAYRATVSPVAAGSQSIAIIYDIWNHRAFGSPASELVHQDTVVVR